MPAPDYTRFLLGPGNGKQIGPAKRECAERKPTPDVRTGELYPSARKLDAITERTLHKFIKTGSRTAVLHAELVRFLASLVDRDDYPCVVPIQ
jgi:hypothetical protein